MSLILKDVKECFKISLKVFIISFVIGLIVGTIVGLIRGTIGVVYLIKCGNNMTVYIASFGLLLSAISFMKQDLMRPLDYKEQWETYFSKFNLSHVIFFVCSFCLIFWLIIDAIIKSKIY